MASDSLRRLIRLDGSFQTLLEDAQRQLGQPLRSRDVDGALLTLRDIDRALTWFEEGKLSAEELCQWADILEMNEQVAYEASSRESIAETLFRLSTPEINEPIDQEVVQQLRESISQSRRC